MSSIQSYIKSLTLAAIFTVGVALAETPNKSHPKHAVSAKPLAEQLKESNVNFAAACSYADFLLQETNRYKKLYQEAMDQCSKYKSDYDETAAKLNKAIDMIKEDNQRIADLHDSKLRIYDEMLEHNQEQIQLNQQIAAAAERQQNLTNAVLMNAASTPPPQILVAPQPLINSHIYSGYWNGQPHNYMTNTMGNMTFINGQ